MNIMERYVTEYMIENEASMNIAQSLIDIINKDDVQSNLLRSIQSMEGYLTHEDNIIRSKAIELLSYIISYCDQNKLNDSTVSVLVNFYCSRLSDATSVPNLMIGLVALTGKYDNFSRDSTKTVIRSLYNEIHVQSFPHITRNAAFQIYENLLNRHLDSLKFDKDEFISSFIRSMTNEKDPRNLMTVYSIIQKIVNLLDITNHVEDIFDVTFCYFPITFRPPPDNPYGITAKDLKLNLRKCMASTPLFSKYALPLLLQKLTTTSGTAKKDALETLTACVKVYPTNDLLLIGAKLFDTIKVEILNTDSDPGLREPSLEAINALTTALANHSAKNIEINKVIRPLIDDCDNLLDELDEESIKPASLILRATASASPSIYSLVECVILPKLLRQYRERSDEKSNRYLILCTMVAIIQARKIVFGPIVNDQKSAHVNHDSILVSYKDRFIEIFSSAIRSSKDRPEVCLMGILGLGLLCVLNNYMTKNERMLGVQLLSTVLETEDDEKLRIPVEASLTEISLFNSSLISEITVPILINALPDFSSSTENKTSKTVSFKLTLTTIQKLCIPPEIYVCSEEYLTRKFIYICSHNEDKKYALEVISTILKLIQSKDKENHTDLNGCINTLILKLITAVVSATFDETSNKKNVIILSQEIIQTINLIILTIFHNLTATEQVEFALKICKYFKERDVSELGLIAPSNFQPLSANAAEDQVACTQIYTTVFSAFKKDVKLPFGSNQEFLNDILDEALKSNCQEQVVSFSRLISSIINKWEKDEEYDSYLDALISRLLESIQAKSLSALTVYIWITKALVVRNHKKGLEMTDSIMNWISDPVIGKQASGAFDVLVGDDPLCLNKQCFANVSFLFKQKFMIYTLSKLLDRFSTSIEDEKLNYLIAIAYILKNVPKSILIDQLPPLVPLLIESIGYPETTLQLSSLDLLQFTLNEATDIIQAHIDILIPALISLIGPKQVSMKIRIHALKCLELVATKISRDITLPFANDTIKALAISLDDKKRLVRKQAVECRDKWYLLYQK